MKLGARILKTGIAIVLAMSIASLLPKSAGLSIVAGIAAVVAMQPSVYRSFKTIVDQFRGNLIGAALAVAMVTVFGNNVIIMGATVILLIALLFKMKIQHVATLATVTALIIMGQHTGSFYTSAFYRFVLVMIGVASSFVVNLTFLPPKFETKIYYNSLNISSDIFVWLKLVLNDTTEYHNAKEDEKQIKQRINKLEQIYDYYKEERTLRKKDTFSKNRKKILFKEVVVSTRRAYDVLRRMNRYQHDLHNVSNDLLLQIKLEIDELTTYHEQIMISLAKKAKFDVEDAQIEINNPQKKNLFDAFKYELIQHPFQTAYSHANIMQVISAIEEYRYTLEHLDRLRLSFFLYHKNDSDIEIIDEDFDL